MNELILSIAGRLTTRRYKRNYTGKRREQRTAAPTYLLSPAAYQTHTGTGEHVPADPDQPTGLLNARHIRTTGQFTAIPAVDTVNSGSAR